MGRLFPDQTMNANFVIGAGADGYNELIVGNVSDEHLPLDLLNRPRGSVLRSGPQRNTDQQYGEACDAN
jgi:hypothetical protein